MRLFSPAQERAWLEHRIRGDAVPDGISLRLRLTGPLDEKALGSALGDLAARHEVLRWTLPTRGDGPRPVVSAGALPAPRVVPVAPERLGAALAEVESRPFDPVTGPLARVSLLALGPEKHVLVVRMHPCVADEGSVAVLAADLAELYRAGAEGDSPRLPGTPRVPGRDDFPRPDAKDLDTNDLDTKAPGASASLPGVRDSAPVRGRDAAPADLLAARPRTGSGSAVIGDDRREFWREALRDVPPLEVATDRPRPGHRSGAGGAHRFEVVVPSELGYPSLAVLAAFAVLLSRCSGQERFTIGAHAPGRVSGLLGGEPNEFAGTAGPLDDLAPLPVDLSGDPDLATLSARLGRAVDDAWRHRLPLQDLVSAVAPPRDPSRGALFDVAYGVVSPPASYEAAGLRLEPLGDEEPAARRTACDLDLRLTAETPDRTGTKNGEGRRNGAGEGTGIGNGEGTEDGHLFQATLTYATDVFDHATIELMAARLTRLLGEMARSPARPVLDLPLDDRSGPIAGPPAAVDLDSSDSTLAALIAAQARRTPEATAVDGDDERLTYRELDERARELAGWLAAERVGPGTVAAICLPRSARLVTVVTGVLYAGGAFLALDPSQPAPRLEYLLSDAAAAVLVSTGEILGGLPEGGGRRLDLDRRDPAPLPLDRLAPGPPGPAGPHDLAYMIYTSGSTGLPKGVLLEHSGACNLVMALAPELGIGPGVRLLQFAPPTFDAWVWEVFTTLVSGGTLCVPEAGNILVGRALSRCLSEREVNAVLLPPSVIATLPGDDPLPGLRVLVTGGEACIPDLVERWGTGRRMVNAYGPTEATVIATLADCSPGEGVPPIGLPMAGAYALVLDAAGRVAPWGVPGELHVGGAGVARGYHRRPALTAERFVPLAGRPPTAPDTSSPSALDGPPPSAPDGPFPSTSDGSSLSGSNVPSPSVPGGPPPVCGGRLYRTGDLVRQRSDGRLDFIGRVDHQVKHRGYRIELGEIEQTLRACPGVDDAAVTLEDEQLVAYVAASTSDSTAASGAGSTATATSAMTMTAKDVRAWTTGRLPGYMVPGTVHVLDELPLTTAGKIDRRRLAASAARAGSRSDEPRDRLELEVLEAFRRVLGEPGIGPHDAFFESGGDSRLAVTLLGHLRGGLRRPMAARLLWERPTAAGLASALRELG
ncbi:amino acid adenylation domain-containing protein [Streptosporangium sp. NPDC050280]|uniref:non-ribosomal peptide synthetase n=1 Tax=unclassified Streptosporangium TaxID=2632669 RepID=UPI003436681E